MKLKIALLVIFGLLVFSPLLTKAELPTGQIDVREKRQEMIKEVQNTRQNIKENILEQKEKRETFRETLQAEREDRKKKIGEMKETFKRERENFKEKIKTIRDERKKLLTEKIDNRMSTVNKNQTDRMLNALERLTEHVNKLEERLVQAKANGVDVSEVEILIATAKNSISTALVAVEEQASKDYVFTIVDEKNLGQSVKSSFDSLSQDLKAVQKLLVKAKEDVVNTYKLAETFKK